MWSTPAGLPTRIVMDIRRPARTGWPYSVTLLQPAQYAVSREQHNTDQNQGTANYKPAAANYPSQRAHCRTRSNEC
jgi:hypothetical protein